jgi:hypothetical protein
MVAIDTQLGTGTSKPENHGGGVGRKQDHTMKLGSRKNLCLSYHHGEKYRTQKLHILTTRFTDFKTAFFKE